MPLPRHGSTSHASWQLSTSVDWRTAAYKNGGTGLNCSYARVERVALCDNALLIKRKYQTKPRRFWRFGARPSLSRLSVCAVRARAQALSAPLRRGGALSKNKDPDWRIVSELVKLSPELIESTLCQADSSGLTIYHAGHRVAVLCRYVICRTAPTSRANCCVAFTTPHR